VDGVGRRRVARDRGDRHRLLLSRRRRTVGTLRRDRGGRGRLVPGGRGLDAPPSAPPRAGLPRFDPTRAHALQALLYLLLATAIGMVLALEPRSTTTLRLAEVYGVCGLLGFFGGMILGVAGRHLPVLLWTRRMHEGVVPALPPYRLARAEIAAIELAAWTVGVPLLAIAFWLEAATPLAIAAVLLLVAVAASALNHVIAARRVLEHAAEVESAS
jgi:hypothetical protein